MPLPDLDKIIDAELGRPRLEVVETRQDKPQVIVRGRHLDEVADDLVRCLVAANEPASMFRHGNAVSRFVPAIGGRGGQLEPVDRNRLLDVIERHIRPVAMRKDDVRPDRVDTVVQELVLLRLVHQLPPVTVVTHTPFLRADGTVCDTAGYDTASGMFLTDASGVSVPERPTNQQILDAVALIDELLCDFPLTGESDRAHCFALLLTPLIRHLVRLVPLFVIDANGPGVGKNLLSECCMYIATGEWVMTNPLPTDNEEQRKQLTAIMRAGMAVALFDEAHIITGVALARLVTSTTWGDRLLGYSTQVNYPNSVTMVALGNNVQIQGDMPRRSVVIRLEATDADPHLRSGFRHTDLRAWVEANRPQLLEALLTLLRAWVVAGRPEGSQPLGSFDGWASIIGGVLEVAGVPGFLGNVGEMRARSATDDTEMEAHLAELSMRFGTSEFSIKQVAKLIEDDTLECWPPRVAGDHGKVRQMIGYTYRRYSGRWLGEFRLQPTGETHGIKRWTIDNRAAQRLSPTGTDAF